MMKNRMTKFNQSVFGSVLEQESETNVLKIAPEGLV